ncbi:glycoside hydrolase family 10 protein [Chitinimonas sp. BJYL2]|uniref:glycoside hydrolase family 10 protein n=1 Tax=Chitinimonas sp. BJYL2 TaxID=2976696 RepID=UPI0022B5A576|nr:family 10 glycosylhydrolase [Chitinimonas sp. BJYL2]
MPTVRIAATASRLPMALFAGLLLLAGCATPPVPTAMPGAPAAAPNRVDTPTPPPAPREFRAAWVSTVANIDWPSKPGLSSEQQQAEALAILDSAVATNLNALVLQVRPTADAIYPSPFEPWSEYLSGEQGKAPQPLYDPLAFWVEEAHKRGIELHAWFNPYRARHANAKSPAAATHISKTHPQLVKSYGDYLWMDPGEAAAEQRALDVITDVVRRYDLDGVHIDDYFYPYPVNAANGSEVPFPDEPSWQRYVAGGGKLARDDWRRDNVNRLIEHLYRAVHAVKPWVKVGVSPFGLGKPDRRAPGLVGFSQYDKLYADAELWLREGWLDYLAPQLYWAIDPPQQAFPVLLAGWDKENVKRRHLWPGLYTSALTGSNRSWPAEEILRQIELSRAQPGASGQIHFSMIALLQDRKGIRSQLQQGLYAEAALVPASPWLDATAPLAPWLTPVCEAGQARASALQVRAAPGKPAVRFAIWRMQDHVWRFDSVPANQTTVSALGASRVSVTAVDRVGNESAPTQLELDCPAPAPLPRADHSKGL